MNAPNRTPADMQGIGWAVKQMQNGSQVTRLGWNGKGQYVGLCTDWTGNVITDGPDFKMLPFAYMKTAQGDIVPWLCSQSDLLAVDWVLA